MNFTQGTVSLSRGISNMQSQGYIPKEGWRGELWAVGTWWQAPHASSLLWQMTRGEAEAGSFMFSVLSRAGQIQQSCLNLGDNLLPSASRWTPAYLSALLSCPCTESHSAFLWHHVRGLLSHPHCGFLTFGLNSCFPSPPGIPCLRFYPIFIWPGPYLNQCPCPRSLLFYSLCIELTSFRFWSCTNLSNLKSGQLQWLEFRR